MGCCHTEDAECDCHCIPHGWGENLSSAGCVVWIYQDKERAAQNFSMCELSTHLMYASPQSTTSSHGEEEELALISSLW